MLPTDAKERKSIPLYRGLVRYFSKTLIAIAKLSMIGNEQHNPGQELHWSKDKSTDHADTLMRHLFETGTIDSDLVPHDVKVAWRACANCETYLDTHPWTESVDDILEFIAKQKAENSYLANLGCAEHEKPFNGTSDEDIGDRINGPTFDHDGTHQKTTFKIGGQTEPLPTTRAEIEAHLAQTSRVPGHNRADRKAMYVVQFQSDDMQAHMRTTTYEGPFLDLEDAEEHAHLNPNNTAGYKSVHAVNAP